MAICAGTISAEIIPNVLAADIGTCSVTPAQVVSIDDGAASVVTNLQPTVIYILIRLSISIVVKLAIFVEEATIVAWIIN